MLKQSGVIYSRKPPLRQRLFSLLSVVAAFILVIFSAQQFLVPKTNVASAWNYQQSPSVAIRNMQFMPSQIVVPAGATIIWRNYDNVPHTVTSDTGIWDTGVLQPGQAIAVRISAAGTFPYHCRIHPFMHGVILVTNRTSPTIYGSGYMVPSATNVYPSSYQNTYYAPMYTTTPVYYSNNYLKNSYPVGTYAPNAAPNINYYVVNPQNNPEANGHPSYSMRNSYPINAFRSMQGYGWK